MSSLVSPTRCARPRTLRSTMTQDQIKAVFAKWQCRLKLTDWQIAIQFVNDGHPDINGHKCHMKVHRSALYKRASIEIGVGSLDYMRLPDCIEKDLIIAGNLDPDTYVEISIVHELLHLPLRDLINTIDLVEEELHPGVRNILQEARQNTEEALVEHLAEALVTNWS
jgi:hypothetical protein